MLIGTRCLARNSGIPVVSHHVRNDISTCNGLSGISIKKLKTAMHTPVPYIRHCVLAMARDEFVKKNMVDFPMFLTLFLFEDAVSM
jgi:hypothetical protein